MKQPPLSVSDFSDSSFVPGIVLKRPPTDAYLSCDSFSNSIHEHSTSFPLIPDTPDPQQASPVQAALLDEALKTHL